MESIEARRARVVETALGWTGTPYLHKGRVKGRAGGVDCLMLLVAVFQEAGELGPDIEIPDYPPDWHFHQTEERYLAGVLRFCDEVEAPPSRPPQPADVVMWKFGKCFSHAAVVVNWPIIVHAYSRRPVGRDDAERTSVLARIHESIPLRGQSRPRKFFTLKSWV